MGSAKAGDVACVALCRCLSARGVTVSSRSSGLAHPSMWGISRAECAACMVSLCAKIDLVGFMPSVGAVGLGVVGFGMGNREPISAVDRRAA